MSDINDLVKDVLANETKFEFPDISKEMPINLKELSDDSDIDDAETAKALAKIRAKLKHKK